MNFTHQIGTHVVQKNHKEAEEEVIHFIMMMYEKVVWMDPEDIINMDQTPIPYSYHTSQTLEKKGTKTIHIRSSTSDTKQAWLKPFFDKKNTKYK